MDRQDISDVASLARAAQDGLRPEYLFFWGHQTAQAGQIGKQCLSQWWEAPFTVDGVNYPTAEHYMMAEKARLFGDPDICQAILAAETPEQAKELGRQVRGFDGAAWTRQRVPVVTRGNTAKFGQNPALKAFLLSTGEKILVEASPLDGIWGIGLAEDDLCARDPRQWQGLNLLGFALMRVRKNLNAGDGTEAR